MSSEKTNKFTNESCAKSQTSKEWRSKTGKCCATLIFTDINYVAKMSHCCQCCASCDAIKQRPWTHHRSSSHLLCFGELCLSVCLSDSRLWVRQFAWLKSEQAFFGSQANKVSEQSKRTLRRWKLISFLIKIQDAQFSAAVTYVTYVVRIGCTVREEVAKS